MREPKVIVGVRHYKDDDKDAFDVEVFASSEYGRLTAERFLQADEGIVDFARLYENCNVSGANHPTSAYDPRAELELKDADLEKTVDWLVENVDADEAYRILLTARYIRRIHGCSLADALENATLWERG